MLRLTNMATKATIQAKFVSMVTLNLSVMSRLLANNLQRLAKKFCYTVEKNITSELNAPTFLLDPWGHLTDLEALLQHRTLTDQSMT